MASAWRVRRRAELREISNTEPERLIALYRFVTGMVVCTEPPKWISFTTMIETILDNQAQFPATACNGGNQDNSAKVPS
jgi:hypothetical protein